MHTQQLSKHFFGYRVLALATTLATALPWPAYATPTDSPDPAAEAAPSVPPNPLTALFPSRPGPTPAPIVPTPTSRPELFAASGPTVPIVVKFKRGSDGERAGREVGSNQAARKLDQIRTHVIHVPATNRDAAIAAFRRHPSVETAAPAVRLTQASIPNDPSYSQQWALKKIAWDQAYGSVSITGSATIALLDTGVDATHPDLVGRLTAGQSFTGGNPNTDPNGHGTAMAGITAANVNNAAGIAGVAWAGTTIASVQVLQTDGTGWDSDVVSGVLWAADHGAKVILMPFSSPDYSAALADALAYAWSKGAVLVAATGNSGSLGATYPAGMPNVIGVAATDSGDAVAANSNLGSANVGAPGLNIQTTQRGGGFGSITGTSAAAAHVSGLAALLAASGKSNVATSNQIRAATDPIAGKSFGRINVARALGANVAPAIPTIGPTPSPGPTPPVFQAAATTPVINDVLFGGANSITVGTGGVGVTASVNASSTANRWRGTLWQYTNVDPGTPANCANTPNVAAPFTNSIQSASTTAPIAVGTYNGYFMADTNSACDGTKGPEFTKASAVTVVSGTLTASVSAVSASSTGNSITFTYTAASPGLTSGEVDVTVPAGWTTPTTGNTSASAGTRTISGNTIKVSSLTLASGATFTITYSSATATSTTGAQTWQAQEKSISTGTLTNLSASPSITVYAIDGSGTLTSDVSTVSASSIGNTITFTYTAASGGMSAGAVELTVPSGWSAPSTTPGSAGYSTASTGSLAVGGQVITVSSITLAAAVTMTIVYGSGTPGAAAPSTGSTQTWQARQKSVNQAGAALTNLASSPSISVYVAVAFSSASSAGGESNTPALLPVSLSATSNLTVTVNYAVTGGSASGSGTDYTLASGTLTFVPSDTAENVSITVNNDTLDENNETIVVTLSNPTNATLGANPTHTYTITDDDSPPTVSFSTASSSGLESASATLTVNLSTASGLTVTAPFSVNGSGTATGGGTDYSITTSPLTFSPGTTSQTISITVNNDTLDENNETVIVDLGTPTNATLGANSTHTYTITDDDPPQVNVAASADATEPSDNGFFTVTRSIGDLSGPLSVSYTVGGTATPDTDYTALSGSVTILALASSATITVAVIDDADAEPDESVTVTVSTNPGVYTIGTGANTLLIHDNDLPVVSIAAGGNASEPATNGAFTVTRATSNTTNPLTVNFTVSGSATSDTDYTSISTSVIIPAASLTATIVVAPLDDNIYEGTETIFVTLASDTAYTIGSPNNAGITLGEDDSAPALSIADSSIAEGDAGTTSLSFTVTRTGLTALMASASYSLADGSASGGGACGGTVDYENTSGSVTVAPGGSSNTTTVSVPVCGDVTYEGSETFTITLASVANAGSGTLVATGTITENDAQPTLSIAGSSITEGASGQANLNFTVTRTGLTGLTASATYTLADVTASGGAACAGSIDFVNASSGGVVSVAAAGATGTATVAVPLCGDATFESDETFTVTLSAPSGATLGTSTATGTISNDDTAPTLAIDDVNVTEGDAASVTATFTVTKTGSTAFNADVSYATANGTATSGIDYIATSGVLTFLPSDTTKTITVTVLGDLVDETDETFFIDLSGAAGSTISDAQGVGTINDNDPPADPSGLTATAASQNQINLTWTDNSVTETDFLLERCAGSGCSSFAQIASVASNVTSYSDTSVLDATLYQYRIRAGKDGLVFSGYSGTAAATTPASRPSNLVSETISQTQINLTWSDNSAGETEYHIERCLGAGCSSFGEITTVPANATSYSNTGLTPDTTYVYRVRAHLHGPPEAFSSYSNTHFAVTTVFFAEAVVSYDTMASDLAVAARNPLTGLSMGNFSLVGETRLDRRAISRTYQASSSFGPTYVEIRLWRQGNGLTAQIWELTYGNALPVRASANSFAYRVTRTSAGISKITGHVRSSARGAAIVNYDGRLNTTTVISGTKLIKGGIELGKLATSNAAVAFESPMQTTSDATPPTISSSLSATANSAGWHNQALTVSWTTNDGESGIRTATGCANKVVSSTPAQGTTLTCTVVNGAGLSASSSVTVKVDRGRPAAKVARAASSSLVAPGESIATSITPGDPVSGVESCSYTATGASTLTGDCDSVSLPAGIWVLSSSVTDVAGNPTTVSFGTYRVYEVSATFADSWTRETAFPVSFRLSDGTPISDAKGSVCLGSSCGAFVWDAASSSHTANLSTSRLSAGAKALTVKVAGAKPASFSLGSVQLS